MLKRLLLMTQKEFLTLSFFCWTQSFKECKNCLLISVTAVDPKSSSLIPLQFWTNTLTSSSVTFSRNKLSFSILFVILVHKYSIVSVSSLVLSKLTSVNSRQFETTVLIEFKDSPLHPFKSRTFKLWLLSKILGSKYGFEACNPARDNFCK